MLIILVSCLSEEHYNNIKEFRTVTESLGNEFLHINLYEDKFSQKDNKLIVNGESYDLSQAAVIIRKWALRKLGVEEQRDDMKDLMEIFKKNNVPVINTADAIKVCHSKWNTYCSLIKNNVQTISTQKVTPENYTNIIASLRLPCIVKPDKGSRGKDVICINSLQEASIVIPKLLSKYKFILLQEKVDIKSDLRIHIMCTTKELSNDINDYEVIGCMKRTSPSTDFRTNFSTGGSIELYLPSPEEALVAKQAAIATGCRWCGVDVLYDNKDNKAKVIEVNSSPGVTGINSLYVQGEKNVIYKVVSIMSGYYNSCDEYNIYEGKKVISFNEYVKLDGVKMIGCFDTGKAGNTVSIAVRNIKQDGDYVTFDFFGKTIRKKMYGTVSIGVRSLDDVQKRICIKMMLEINGREKEVFVSLREYIGKKEKQSTMSKVLIGTDIISDFNFLVSPDRTKLFLLKESFNDDWKQRVCFLRDEWPENLRNIKISKLAHDLFYFPKIKDEKDDRLTKDMPLINYINDGSKHIDFLKRKYSCRPMLKNSFDVLSICNNKIKFYDTFKDSGFIPQTYCEDEIKNLNYNDKILMKPSQNSHSGIGIKVVNKNDIICNGYDPKYIYSKYIDVKDEYRILLYNNNLLLCYRRRPKNSAATKQQDERIKFIYELTEPDSDFIRKIHKLSDIIYDKIKFNGLIGLDIMIDADGKFWCPEINSRSGLGVFEFVILYFYVIKNELGIDITDDMMRYCYDTYVCDTMINNQNKLLANFEKSDNNISILDYNSFKEFCKRI